MFLMIAIRNINPQTFHLYVITNLTMDCLASNNRFEINVFPVRNTIKTSFPVCRHTTIYRKEERRENGEDGGKAVYIQE